MIALLEKFSATVARATNIVVVIMTVCMMTALIAQVFSRYVLGASLIWSEELALTLFTWVTLLAATTALREGAHVRLDLLLTTMPAGVQRAWSAAIMLVILLVSLVFAWSGYTYTAETLGQVSAAMRVPIEVLHLAAPVTGMLAALHALARLLNPLPVAPVEIPG